MSHTMSSGVIIATHGDTGPASEITYDVRINWPDGTVRDVPGVQPTCNRPPDDYDTIPAEPGTDFLVAFVGDRVRIFIQEYPDSAECA